MTDDVMVNITNMDTVIKEISDSIGGTASIKVDFPDNRGNAAYCTFQDMKSAASEVLTDSIISSAIDEVGDWSEGKGLPQILTRRVYSETVAKVETNERIAPKYKDWALKHISIGESKI